MSGLRLYSPDFKPNRHHSIRESYDEDRGPEVPLAVKLWENGELLDHDGRRWVPATSEGDPSLGPNGETKKWLSGYFRKNDTKGEYQWIAEENKNLANSFVEWRTGRVWKLKEVKTAVKNVPLELDPQTIAIHSANQHLQMRQIMVNPDELESAA